MQQPSAHHVESISHHLVSAVQQAAKSASSQQADGALARGKVLQLAGMFHAAVAQYQEAGRSGNLEGQVRAALAQLMSGDYQSALASATALNEKHGDASVKALATGEDVPVRAVLGDALLLSGREQEAEAAYRDAVAKHPHATYPAGRLALLLLARGDTAGASSFSAAVKDDPRYAVLADLSAARGSFSMDRIRNLVGHMVPGRPLVVDDELRFAERASTVSWAAPIAIGDAAARGGDAAGWTRAALGEHASVAAFARVILQLVALGAPADLLAATARALQEEIEHARMTFGVAGALGGSPAGVGAMDLGDLRLATAPADVLRDTLLGGCVGETISAAEAAAAAERTDDPAVRAVLERIASDERSHAELAWTTVAWLLEKHPYLAAQAIDVVAAVAFGDTDEPSEFGQLDAATRSRIAADALVAIKARIVEVAAPVLRATLTTRGILGSLPA